MIEGKTESHAKLQTRKDFLDGFAAGSMLSVFEPKI
jgi:hypothetical protein